MIIFILNHYKNFLIILKMVKCQLIVINSLAEFPKTIEEVIIISEIESDVEIYFGSVHSTSI